VPNKFSKFADAALISLAFIVGSLAIYNFVTSRLGGSRSATEELADIEGETLPAFAVQYVGGGRDSVPAGASPTVLYFFVTTCAACERNKASWEAVVDSLGGSVHAVAVSPEPLETVSPLYSVPRAFDVGVIAKDDQSRVVQDYRMWATPTTYVLDRSGKLHLSVVGAFDAAAINRIVTTARRLQAETSN